MKPENKTPLGHIQLKNGLKAIYPMNDIFAMYMFQYPEHWEDLKLLVNLIITAYIGVKPNTRLQPVEGDVTIDRRGYRQRASRHIWYNVCKPDQTITRTKPSGRIGGIFAG